jgi:hypothetical protein
MQILYAQLEYSTYLASDLKCMHLLCVRTDGGMLRKRNFQGAILIDGLSWLLEIYIKLDLINTSVETATVFVISPCEC